MSPAQQISSDVVFHADDKDRSVVLVLWSTNDTTNHVYVRNTALWWQDADWTCIPARGNDIQAEEGVLVTPDILIQAYHAHSTGSIYFTGNDNSLVVRNILSGVQIGSTDLFVARLDSPVPSSITPAQVLPPTAFSGPNPIFSNVDIVSRTLWCVYTRYEKRLLIGAIASLDGITEVFQSTDPTLSLWYAPIVGGDSGSPCFLVINNQPVALCTWQGSNFSNESFGPSIANYLAEINSAITGLGSATQLSVIDLSGFIDKGVSGGPVVPAAYSFSMLEARPDRENQVAKRLYADPHQSDPLRTYPRSRYMLVRWNGKDTWLLQP